MRTIRVHLPEIAMILASLAFVAVAGVTVKLVGLNNDNKALVQSIQDSRVALSRQSCVQRNKERAVARSNLRRSLAQLAQISDAALAQLGFSRDEAVAQVHRQLRQVHRLDCNKLIKQVSGERKLASVAAPAVVGGGAGPNKVPRPRSDTRSDSRRGGQGGGDTVVPNTPGESGGGTPQPPSGGGGGDTSPQPEPGTGTGSQPEQPAQQPGGLVDTLKDTVPQLIDPVCKIVQPPLGPVIRICP